MGRTLDDTLIKLEKTQTALSNARQYVERLKERNKELIAKLEIYAPVIINIDRAEFSRKQATIERECIYGLTHFCDGKVNSSIAKEGTKPLPPCPCKAKCELRKKTIIREGERE